MTSKTLTSVSNETQSMPQSAANTFFHNPDLCTLFANTLLSITLPSSTTKPCHTPSSAPLLLTFRGITRSTYNAVMFEHPARVALGLDPQDISAAGIVVYPEPKEQGELAMPYVSHSETDNATLLSWELEDEEEAADEQERRRADEEYNHPSQLFFNAQRRHTPRRHHQSSPQLAQVFTHHPALSHQITYDPSDGTTLCLSSDDFALCSTLPLAREMFLTQPPQRRIAFRVRYEYSPGTRKVFSLRNEEGIRFGELVEFFEREPGMMKQAVDPKGALGRYRRWLRDGEFVWMNQIEWEVGRGVVRGGPGLNEGNW
jgi:hypothetical protein